MGKITSIAKKVYNINLDAYSEGKRNFDIPDADTEELAKQRALICAGCDMNEVEPISELKVTDPRIPSISNRYCDACGCTLPYLLRQSIKTCKLKKW